MFKHDHLKTPYLILRLIMGFNFFVHGLVRIPKLESFSNWMLGLFKDSLIPEILILPFSYSLPFIELIIGFLLIIGFKTMKAINAGNIIILCLVTGSCLIEKWNMAGGQMLYALFFFILAVFVENNDISLDSKL